MGHPEFEPEYPDGVAEPVFEYFLQNIPAYARFLSKHSCIVTIPGVLINEFSNPVHRLYNRSFISFWHIRLFK